jgi:hypothetical protein
MTPNAVDFDRAIARIPRWILGLACLGTAVALAWKGLTPASSFLGGSVAAWLNFKMIERFVNRVARLAANAGPGRAAGSGKWVFIRFAFLLLGVSVILRFSGFSVAAGFLGFLVCPAAVILEIVYELFTYGHS